MSNYLAVATVSAALKQIIQVACHVVGGAEVKLGRPVKEDPSLVGAHLYLYNVRPNAGISNNDLPTRSRDGVLMQLPSAAVDLYYLVSFYGDQSQLVPQRLMGSTMCALLAQPLLTRDRIREVTSPDGPYDFLAESDLENQVESVKFTQVYPSIEDFSRLWGLFTEVPHVLSINYQVSVVTLEPQLPTVEAKEVKEPNFKIGLGEKE